MGGTRESAERECMRQKYMFVAAMLLFLALASIGLTEAYIQYAPDGGKVSTSDNPDAPGGTPADPDTTGLGSTPADSDTAGLGSTPADPDTPGLGGAPADTAGSGSAGTENGQPGTGHTLADPQAEHSFYVVTSFYPIYIAAKNIIGGCEGVTLQNLSEPQTGCLHDYQLTTGDMRTLSQADALIINGGGMESFLPDVAGQYPDLAVIDASTQAALLEENAHAWMSVEGHITQIKTITDSLSALDTAHAREYQENAAVYQEKLEILRQKQQDALRTFRTRKILIFHEAFAYVARDYGLSVSGGMDLDEERQVSAGEVADILRLIRQQDVDVILAEELYGRRMCETVQKEADVQVIYLDTCVRGDYEADSYLRAMEENLEQMKKLGISN